ncbi:ankyrin repeat domain-containing protein [Paenibacillus pasadenensis]|uniref:ankyrin repeat domain-containing protein n=1 Tax=Paenibacillus pasadenensis TaxID=217090 RepID=UPI00203CA566|nr:ankyrin repeat domain-containing protein [Paenibacillus pasadenensis]MCM3746296.1 ankyrin repeat domain-containing protein [Paenibacillus pasadenensis]
MKKWLIIVIGCMFILQGCSSAGGGNEGSANNQGGETDTMNEQLLQAAQQKDSAALKRLIEEGADLNVQDAKGRTAAMIATYNNDVQSVRVLVEAGADVNMRDDMRNTPFLYAGAEGYLDILRLTIQAGADPAITNRYGGTALIPASEHGYTEVVKELLTKTEIDVDHVNNLGWTALLESIILNNGNTKQQDTLRLLIEHGADVNLADSEGVTPLQHARGKGLKEMEQILLQAGAK